MKFRPLFYLPGAELFFFGERRDTIINQKKFIFIFFREIYYQVIAFAVALKRVVDWMKGWRTAELTGWLGVGEG